MLEQTRHGSDYEHRQRAEGGPVTITYVEPTYVEQRSVQQLQKLYNKHTTEQQLPFSTREKRGVVTASKVNTALASTPVKTHGRYLSSNQQRSIDRLINRLVPGSEVYELIQVEVRALLAEFSIVSYNRVLATLLEHADSVAPRRSTGRKPKPKLTALQLEVIRSNCSSYTLPPVE
jgi:hypothetical protein